MFFQDEKMRSLKVGVGDNYVNMNASGVTLGGNAKVTLPDVGNFTAQTDAAGMVQEIYQHLKSIQHTILIPLGSLTEEDGTALTIFADGDSATPGFNQVSNKELVLRWNNHASPAKVGFSIPMPQNIDSGAVAVVHFMAKMTGTTDTPALETEAYFNAGDTDCAGTDDEIDGAATLTEYTNTIALADVPASPSCLTVLFGPKATELGTDDLLLHGVWVEFKGSVLTS